MPIDLSEVALDIDLAVPFCIIRNSGQRGPGGWIPGPTCQIQAFGIESLPSPHALEQIAEGDRVTGALQIITTTPMYQTLADRSATSDTVMYFGEMYKVVSVEPWRLNNYFSVILTRMAGE
jgi:hypothetical protein